jgi:hypothetical protein
MTDEHDSDASCTTIRDYIEARRLARLSGLAQVLAAAPRSAP